MSDPAFNVNDVMEQRIRELAYLLWERAGCPDGRSDEFWHLAQSEIAADEASYDEAVEESFPASDSPSHTPPA